MAVSSSSAYFLCPNVAVYRPHRQPTSVSATSSSFYEVLGIPVGATCQDIKSAYRRLARTVHPDVAAAASEANAREFMRIHEAYTTLSDLEKRGDYDRMIYGRRCIKATAYPTVVGLSSVSGYTRRRTWETDQCW